MAELTPTQWIAQCTNRLQLRQHTLYRMQWEEGALSCGARRAGQEWRLRRQPVNGCSLRMPQSELLWRAA